MTAKVTANTIVLVPAPKKVATTLPIISTVTVAPPNVKIVLKATAESLSKNLVNTSINSIEVPLPIVPIGLPISNPIAGGINTIAPAPIPPTKPIQTIIPIRNNSVDLDDLKKSISTLGVDATNNVNATREAFSSGAPPFQTVNSGSTSDFVSQIAASIPQTGIVTSTSKFGLSTSTAGPLVTSAKPEIDLIEVDSDASVGVLDSFYTRIIISLAISDLPLISCVRILRSVNGQIGVPTPTFSAMIDALPLTVSRKNSDPVAVSSFRANEIGVGNEVATNVQDSKFATLRGVVTRIGATKQLPAPINTNRGTTLAGLVSIKGADRSVLENATISTNQRSIASTGDPLPIPLTVGKIHGINILKGSPIAKSTPIVETGNSAGFSEIARLTAAKSKKIGNYVEIEFIDPAVVYGSSYSYYAVTTSPDGNDSPRSRIVVAEIKRNLPPAIPAVMFSVVAGLPRFSIRCSGTFIDHIEVMKNGGNTENVPEIDSGFYLLRDLGVNVDRSTTFVDNTVTPGQRLQYRFYTVDSFGTKSSSPFSCSLMLPDHGRVIPLVIPTISAEQNSNGRSVNVNFSSDDPRVVSFVLGRRESGAERSFRQPGTADFFTLGSRVSAKRSKSRIGPKLNAESLSNWSGIFPQVSGAASFVDQSVEFDRIYQYSVYSVDIKGNMSPHAQSKSINVSTKPIIAGPVGIQIEVMGDSSPTGVKISWSDSTLNFSPTDLVGDQNVLDATSVRTVFQVERRQTGKSTWDPMPPVTGTTFIDTVSTDPAPVFRPTYPVTNMKYDYRVIAMQSGGFLSTYSDTVKVAVAPAPPVPATVWTRSTPTAIRPLNVIVSWQYDGAFVNTWEVQRASANKIFASKIFSMDSADAQSLSYATVANVSNNGPITMGSNLDVKIYIGNRFYVDQDISLANSYYYRVRAINSAGDMSDWTYSGISLADSPFDRKLQSTISDAEKTALASDPRAIAKLGFK